MKNSEHEVAEIYVGNGLNSSTATFHYRIPAGEFNTVNMITCNSIAGMPLLVIRYICIAGTRPDRVGQVLSGGIMRDLVFEDGHGLSPGHWPAGSLLVVDNRRLVDKRATKPECRP